MNNLLLHPQTKQSLDNFIDQPSHALLLTGPAGAGKDTLARELAARMLGLKNARDLSKQAYFHELAVLKDKTSISIEQVRELQSKMTLKTIGQAGKIKRVALISGAGLLQVPAQNSLLKLLEEPPIDSVILLTSTHEDAVLPTVRSRAQRVAIRPVTEADAQSHFSKAGHKEEAIHRAYMLSDGYAGLMTALLADDTTHQLVIDIETAKKVLAADHFTRLAMLDQFTADRARLKALVDTLQRTARAALKMAASKNNIPALKRWQRIIKQLDTAQAEISHNAQAKLVLTNLFLNL